MVELSYRVDKVWFRDFGAMVAEMLEKLPPDRVPLRLVFFGNPDHNNQYLEHRAEILRQVAQRYGGIEMPLVSYVAQVPLDCGLALESHWAQVCAQGEKQPVSWTRKVYKRTNYIRLDTRAGRWLFTEGILPASLEAPVQVQAREVLGVLGELLAREGLPVDAIVRQWNYIERITEGLGAVEQQGCGGEQHYQAFNNARSEFYARARWKSGYPAATGIGTKLGGIMVEVDALAAAKRKRTVVALDNELQVAAHDYSRRVLVGRDGGGEGDGGGLTTPKFERAKAIVFKKEHQVQVYVSGTAAIRGENSLAGIGVLRQTEITLENIRHLISTDNLRRHGIRVPREAKIKNFRVYLKAESALEPVRDILLRQYGDTPVLYVQSDVCRDELLVEIEGAAQSWGI